MPHESSRLAAAPLLNLFAGDVALLLVLFQHRARSHFLGPFSVTAGPLSAIFDVFVLALLLLANSSYAFLSRHEITPGCRL